MWGLPCWRGLRLRLCESLTRKDRTTMPDQGTELLKDIHAALSMQPDLVHRYGGRGDGLLNELIARIDAFLSGGGKECSCDGVGRWVCHSCGLVKSVAPAPASEKTTDEPNLSALCAEFLDDGRPFPYRSAIRADCFEEAAEACFEIARGHETPGEHYERGMAAGARECGRRLRSLASAERDGKDKRP